MKLLLLAAVAALSGCATSGSYGPGDMDILEGKIDNGDLSAASSYSAATQSMTVTVAGSVTASKAENITVDVYLAGEACSDAGPDGTPSTPLDHKRLSLDRATSYELTLRAEGPPGRYHVYALPSAENAIGPVFGLCRTLIVI